MCKRGQHLNNWFKKGGGLKSILIFSQKKKKKNSSTPWQRQPNKVAFVCRAGKSAAAVAVPSAFTRARLLERRAFRNIPPPAALCACHLLLRWTDKTSWRGAARVTGQNYAVINPSIRPGLYCPQRIHCPPCQQSHQLLGQGGTAFRNLQTKAFWKRNLYKVILRVVFLNIECPHVRKLGASTLIQIKPQAISSIFCWKQLLCFNHQWFVY